VWIERPTAPNGSTNTITINPRGGFLGTHQLTLTH
jgi:hypothetical protein